MKKTNGWLAIIFAAICVICVEWLNSNSIDHENRPIVMVFCGICFGVFLLATCSWFRQEWKIAKRKAELSQKPPSGLDRSMSWMRQDEEKRLDKVRATGGSGHGRC